MSETANYVGPHASFMPGLELSAAFYREAVEPILRRNFPGLVYAAGRIGPGSDVLAFDDQRSTDHFWGPLLSVFLSDDDLDRYGEQIKRVLANELPFGVHGFPTNFRPLGRTDARLGHLGHMAPTQTRPITGSRGHVEHREGATFEHTCVLIQSKISSPWIGWSCPSSTCVC